MDWINTYEVPSISFQTFVQAFKIVIDSWKFTMLLLYILWDDWPIFMISSSNEQLQRELEYTLLKPDCHSWWISKVQSGREDTLEEQYAIKFCFKLGKNATETYGMLQTALGASCMNRAWVFEWHKRFKEGRESVRDDVRCGRSKEVRTPELIGQMKNFMDKDRRVSIETISAQFDVSMGTVHNYSRGTEDAEDLNEVCPKGVQRRSERKTSWQQGDSRADQFRSHSSWCSGDLRWKLDLLLWPRDRFASGSMLALPDPRRPGRANPPTNFWWFFFFFFFFRQHWHDVHALGSHWTDSQQGILCWGFKGVQEEIPSKEASTLQIGSVPFPPGQCTSLQLHPCHRLFDQDGHQDSSSPSL